MLINWFTLVAQIVNFLILIWLLNKFLYKPVLKALDEREARIASIISDAELMKLNAMKELDEYSAKKSAIDKETESILQTSRTTAEQERLTIINNAKNMSRELIEKQNKMLNDERDSFYNNATSELTSQLIRITEKVLITLSDLSLESHLVNKCIDNLSHFPEQERLAISNLLQKCNNILRIRASQPLSSDIVSQLQESLSSVFGPAIIVQFEHAPHLLCGIELIIDTYKLSWNAHDYIQKALIDITRNSETASIAVNGDSKELVQ